MLFLSNIFKKLKDSKRLSQILILISFLITFLAVREVVDPQMGFIISTSGGPLHIHHLVPGIILVIISGYFGLSFWGANLIRELMSILFGIGAGLAIDEFALWLYLKDVYFAKEGARSIEAVITTLTIFLIIFIISEAHDHAFFKKLLQIKKQ